MPRYIILKHNDKRRKWEAKATVFSSSQSTAFTAFKDDSKQNLNGEYWILPVSHSGFRTFKKGKLIKRERYYKD